MQQQPQQGQSGHVDVACALPWSQTLAEYGSTLLANGAMVGRAYQFGPAQVNQRT